MYINNTYRGNNKMRVIHNGDIKKKLKVGFTVIPGFAFRLYGTILLGSISLKIYDKEDMCLHSVSYNNGSNINVELELSSGRYYMILENHHEGGPSRIDLNVEQKN